MIKAIVFDMGDVLMDLDKEACTKAFQDLGFEEITEYIDKARHKGFWGEMESGDISGEEFISECLKHCRPGTTAADIRACIAAFHPGIAAYKIDLLKELKAKYPLYMLSNNNPLSVDEFISLGRRHGVEMMDFFREVYFSYQVRMQKPDPEIYQYAIEHIGLRPEEILFIDDNAANCAASVKAGITTVHYDPKSNLRDAIMAVIS